MQVHFQNHLEKFLQTEDLAKVVGATLEEVQKAQFTISDIGITHRWITHWHDQGLLLNDKPKRKWRTFDMAEFIWLRLIVKLRALGVDLERIRSIKTVLGSPIPLKELMSDPRAIEVARKAMGDDSSDKVSDDQISESIAQEEDYPLFQIGSWMKLFVLDWLITKEPFAFIITWKGEVFTHRWNYPLPMFSDSNNSTNSFTENSFISVSMNELIADILSRQSSYMEEAFPKILSEAEWQLLLEINSGNAKEINIKLKDGSVQTLEVTESVQIDRSARLGEILLKGAYQSLDLKTVNGEIISAQITDKTKYS